MASFLWNNQPWAQLTERGNISLHEIDPTGTSEAASVQLTPSVSFLPIAVPHRAELSDTVAYVVSLTRNPDHNGNTAASLQRHPQPSTLSTRCSEENSPRTESVKLLYCPDTDGWLGWKRDIRDWCEEVDVALLDATFYDAQELNGVRDMSEVMRHTHITSSL